jgi:hypothetical protein
VTPKRHAVEVRERYASLLDALARRLAKRPKLQQEIGEDEGQFSA